MDARVAEPNGKPTLPRCAPLRFASYTLDLDGCALTGADGSAVPLTHSEFSLLREFVRHPGRVLSRDHLLDVLAGRRADPFDRSIDMLVARLRRKIEPDQKRPSLIVTVPGEGYKLAASVTTAPAPDGLGVPVETSNEGDSLGTPARPASFRPRRSGLAAVGALLLALLMGGGWWLWPRKPAVDALPIVAVLPFANLTGDPAQDYFGKGIAVDLITLLGTFPSLQVVAAPDQGREMGIVEARKLTGAQYVLRGGVQKSAEKVRITAQLYDANGVAPVWSDLFDSAGQDAIAIQADIADRIYQSLAGLHGNVLGHEQRAVWRKATPSLGEYDYVLRGLMLYLRFTPDDVLHARQVWQDGLAAFPDSNYLRIKLAWTYVWPVVNERSDDPPADIERAWRLAAVATKGERNPAHAVWIGHWLMAFLHQFHDNDFARSVDEARAAVQLVPYDAESRNDLSFILANAGRFDEALDWALWGVNHDPHPPDWYYANVGWPYYFLKRYDEVLKLQQSGHLYAPVLLAATYVRLGRIAEARQVIAASLKTNPRDSIAVEAYFPLVEPYKQALLSDLRAAGLPEK